MMQVNNTPVKWLAVCVSLVALYIIKEYGRVFMSRSVFVLLQFKFNAYKQNYLAFYWNIFLLLLMKRLPLVLTTTALLLRPTQTQAGAHIQKQKLQV